MAFTPGTRIGAYELVGAIGAGGMGEVYRARDTRLNRDVAIKVLPDSVSSDREHLARFEREASVLASLNHPNIAHVYGFEHVGDSAALVMELVDGDDLSEALNSGPLSSDRVVAIASQIVDALAAAHERGIVHRDLKPGNIKIRRDAIVKVLDFGLAKPSAKASNDQATITRHDLTRPGVIVGTPAYMSPEQIAGEAVDPRSDVWSFGCVLFEMLSGRKAFAGNSAVEQMGAVLKSDPDWSSIAGASPSLKALIRRCLQKDASRRLGSIADAKMWLEDTSTLRSTPLARPSHAARWIAVTASLVAVAAVGYALWPRQSSLEPPPIKRLQIAFTPPYLMTGRPTGGNYALSPDGGTLVFHSLVGDSFQLVRRKLDALDAVPIPGTDRAQNMTFSPDGTRLAFYSRGAIRTIALSGGAPTQVCEWLGIAPGVAWTDDGYLWLTRVGDGVFRVPVAGGTPVKIYMSDRSKGEAAPFSISPIPGGAVVVFVPAIRNSTGRPKLIALRSESTEPKTLIDDAGLGAYAAGHLMFVQEGALRAAPFDARRLEVTGPPFTLAEKSPNQARVSEDGTVLYLQSGVEAGPTQFNLNILARDGRVERTLSNKAIARHARVSPDGRSLIVVQASLNFGEVWRYALQSQAQPIRLTGGAGTGFPIWSPDGRELVLQRGAANGQALFAIAADGSAAEPTLLTSGDDVIPEDWSPDGTSLLVQITRAQTGTDLMFFDRATGAQKPWLQTASNEAEARIAPGGRWVTYVSDQTGRAEVWVRAFDGTGAPVRVSADGGHEPRWSASGRTIYFTNGTHMMAADITASSTISASPPRQLFEGGFIPYNSTYRRIFDVTADDRFVVVQTDAVEPNQPLVVLLNAFRSRR